MSTFKSQAEIYKHLLDGGKVKSLGFSGLIVFLNEKGFVVDQKNNKLTLHFQENNLWEPYIEPKWYENIPKNGVLCWVSDESETSQFQAERIVRVNKISIEFVDNFGEPWKYATPVKPEDLI